MPYVAKPFKFDDWKWGYDSDEEIAEMCKIATLDAGGTYSIWQIESGEVLVVRAADSLRADMPIQEQYVWWVVNGPMYYPEALEWLAENIRTL
jgi:hypothetical protein